MLIACKAKWTAFRGNLARSERASAFQLTAIFQLTANFLVPNTTSA